jgi:hypothetical protein
MNRTKSIPATWCRWLARAALPLLPVLAVAGAATADVTDSGVTTERPAVNALTDLADVAGDPQDICPLLVGSCVPAVILTTSEGKPFDLAAALARQRTVLIIYRGGW